MWSWLSANATQLIAIGAAVGSYVWNRLHMTSQAQDNSLVASALAQIGALFSAYAHSASTTKTLADMSIELRGLAAVEMGKLGIYEGTATRALLDAGVNALIAQAIQTLVMNHPEPTTLHAEVKATVARSSVV